jgi:hypothetical protein
LPIETRRTKSTTGFAETFFRPAGDVGRDISVYREIPGSQYLDSEAARWFRCVRSNKCITAIRDETDRINWQLAIASSDSLAN